MQELAAEIARYPHGRVPRALRERQLLELGRELFSERGYAGASMDELARRAGVSKPVIYDLVGSKDELYRACARRAADELYARVSAAIEGAPEVADKVREGGLAFFRFVAEHRRSWEALFFGAEGRFEAEVESIRRRQTELVAGVLEVGAKELGARLDARQLDGLAHAINGSYEALAAWWYAHPDIPPETLADWVLELVLPGLQQIADSA